MSSRFLATKADQVAATREGGMVQRCHAGLVHFGSYNNAEHTYGVLQLLRIYAPPDVLDTKLYAAVLNHDVAERWTGDVPAPTKWFSPEIKRGLTEMEDLIEATFGLAPDLNAEQKVWLKAADILELYLWAHEQVNLGNKRAHRLINNINVFIFNADVDFLPGGLRRFYDTYVWDVLPEDFRSVRS